MGKNTKKTSKKVASLAAKTLNDPNASGIQKSLAGAALSQFGTGKQTGAEMEEKAARVLQSDKYATDTLALAGSVTSQANKKR